MKYKTAFRLGVRLIAVLVCAMGCQNLAWAAYLIYEWATATATMPFGYTLMRALLGPTEFLVGVGLWFAAGAIADRAIPSNRPYCNQCGYDLSDRTGDGVCPECGIAVAFSPVDREVAARRRFEALCRRLAPKADAARVFQTFASLVLRYGEAGRAYHTLRHVTSCLDLLDRHRHSAESPDVIALAIWYHDFIYEPRRSDNEERSALHAVETLDWLIAPADAATAVRELILATRHKDRPQTPDAALLVDIDLAILGSPPEEYDAYAAAIRREYAHVPDSEYAAGRAAFLRSMLAREGLYNTAAFQRSHEAQARENMERELKAIDEAERSDA